jgi:hypothetical protein
MYVIDNRQYVHVGTIRTASYQEVVQIAGIFGCKNA